jgi:hypothetical protein
MHSPTDADNKMSPNLHPESSTTASNGAASPATPSETNGSTLTTFDLRAIKASLADAERNAQRTLLAQRTVMRNNCVDGENERNRGGNREGHQEGLQERKEREKERKKNRKR